MREKIAADAGVHLFALELERQRTVKVGSLGSIRFEKEWYIMWAPPDATCHSGRRATNERTPAKLYEGISTF